MIQNTNHLFQLLLYLYYILYIIINLCDSAASTWLGNNTKSKFLTTLESVSQKDECNYKSQ